jgi:AmmeMemoRadiSam system protein A
MDPTELGRALLATSRRTLEQAFGATRAAPLDHAALDRPGATFVTLTQHGGLRGCIGTLEAHRSLREDVAENTLNAALRDPRFAPLAAAEVELTRIEVSLLQPAVPLPVADEDDLLRRLRPGTDGVVLAFRGRRATFLPQVWDGLREPREFVRALKRKAGLAADFWHEEIRVSRYAVSKFREHDPRDARRSA